MNFERAQLILVYSFPFTAKFFTTANFAFQKQTKLQKTSAKKNSFVLRSVYSVTSEQPWLLSYSTLVVFNAFLTLLA